MRISSFFLFHLIQEAVFRFFLSRLFEVTIFKLFFLRLFKMPVFTFLWLNFFKVAVFTFLLLRLFKVSVQVSNRFDDFLVAFVWRGFVRVFLSCFLETAVVKLFCLYLK